MVNQILPLDCLMGLLASYQGLFDIGHAVPGSAPPRHDARSRGIHDFVDRISKVVGGRPPPAIAV